MTLININVVDVTGGYHPGDRVRLRAPSLRGDGSAVISTAWRTVILESDGTGSEMVSPGPLEVQLDCRGVSESTPLVVTVPDVESITLRELLEQSFTYAPPVVSEVASLRDQAVEARDRTEDIATAFGSLEGVESEVQAAKAAASAAEAGAATAAGHATQTADDRRQTGEDRSHVDQVRTELDEAFDESTAGNVLPPRLTETALNATYRTAVIPQSSSFGVITHASLQAAADEAFSTGRHLFAEGVCSTDQTLVLRCSGDLSGLKINYTGSGECVRVGTTAATTQRLALKLPKIECMNKPSTGWVDGTIGVHIVQMSGSDITIPFVYNFETGVRLYAGSGGCAYNNIAPVDVWGWKVGLDFYSDWAASRGWVNENKFFGGRVSQGGQGALANIRFSGSTSDDGVEGTPNNNQFFGTCLEGGSATYTIDFNNGRVNGFYGCRWEYSRGVRFGPASHENVLLGGYGLDTVPIIQDPQAVRNIIDGVNYKRSGQQQWYYRYDAPSKTVRPHPSIVINPGLSRLSFGPGTSAASAYITGAGVDALAVAGSAVVPAVKNAGGTEGTDCGTAANMWRDVSAGRYIRLGGLLLRESGGELQVATSTSGPWRTVTAA